jgi:hypothetical protein
MYDDELIERLRGYVRENRGTYTTEAMRARLIKDGAPADAVDMVLAEAAPYAPPDAPAADTGARQFPVWPFVGVAALSVAANVAVIFAAVIIALGSESGGAVAAVLLLGLGLEIAAAAAIGRWARMPSRGLLVALTLTPVAVAALTAGACFAMFS